MANRGFFIAAAKGIAAALLCSCSFFDSSSSALSGDIRILSWNTQTFFDATADGGEFDEFSLSRGQWNVERYRERLDRLAEGLLSAGLASGMGSNRSPDIAVLQEIENERVLKDLWNRLPPSCGYAHAVFVPLGPGCSFGTGILSRVAPRSVRSHAIDGDGVSLRPMVEAQFVFGSQPFVLYACHWKSKTGSGGDSELRKRQESLVLTRIAELEKEGEKLPVIICGDFNQTLDEFGPMSALENGWTLDTGKAGGGSYCYQGVWERIDHFFYSDHFSDGISPDVVAFRVINEKPFINEEGKPFRYEIFSGRGYSDHLPLVLTLR